MKKSDVKKNFIKIDGVTHMNIIRHSGLDLRMIRTGNKFHSTRNTCLYMPNQNKRHWPVVVYSYSKVQDPEGYTCRRDLDVSENYLNPDFKYLLEKV